MDRVGDEAAIDTIITGDSFQTQHAMQRIADRSNAGAPLLLSQYTVLRNEYFRARVTVERFNKIAPSRNHFFLNVLTGYRASETVARAVAAG